MRINSNSAIQAETFSSATINYLKQPRGVRYLLLRPTVLCLKWVEWGFSGLSKTALRCKEIFGHSNHFFLCLSFPLCGQLLLRSLSKLKIAMLQGSLIEISKKSTSVFIRTFFLTDLIVDSIRIAHFEKLITLTSLQLKILNTIGFLGSVAIFISGVKGVKKYFTQMTKLSHEDPAYNLALIHLVRKISFAGIGLFGTVSFIVGRSCFAQWILLANATAFLLLSVGAYFYEKMYVKPKQLEKEELDKKAEGEPTYTQTK